MQRVGRVESLWRYPVKSMRGEQLQHAFVGFGGIHGDRCYAFISSAARKEFPYLTAREKQTMLLYRPIYRSTEDLTLDVETLSGALLAIDDPLLITDLREGLREGHELTLLRSERALTDCRPISLFSTQTARQLTQELGIEVDKRRFRANIYVDLVSGVGFGEDEFVGRTLQVGPTARIAVIERDPRCKMITLDSDTGAANPEIMRKVARSHEGNAGVYGEVLVEGTIRPGDTIELLD